MERGWRSTVFKRNSWFELQVETFSICQQLNWGDFEMATYLSILCRKRKSDYKKRESKQLPDWSAPKNVFIVFFSQSQFTQKFIVH